ncbi:MAG: phosphatase PAP2 family protein [Lachnospiraceae bacterium]|nr:phosphatase PAP2 family protein [Lachnospiraceae bacterium]
MKKWIGKYGHAWCLLYVLIYLPWFAFLEKNVTKYHLVHSSLDDWIPFCEYFIIPYLLWFAYVSIAVLYFFFTSKKEYYQLCTFLFVGMTISLIICTIWPNGHDLRPAEFVRENVFTRMVEVLYTADTSTNVFPSIHVFNSIGVQIAVQNSERLRNKRWIRVLSGVLCISIICSTVLLKQHSILDVFGGIALGAIMNYFVYRTERGWGRQEELKKQWD